MSEVFKILGDSGGNRDYATWTEATEAAWGIEPVLIIIGIAVTEWHTYLQTQIPLLEFITVDVWLSPWYSESMSLVWYLYELEQTVAKIIWFYAFAMIAGRVNYQLFKIMSVFVGYHITQYLFYICNRNTNSVANMLVYICMGIILNRILKQTGKYIKM